MKTLYPTENGIFFFKQCSPRDTAIPLEHDYIFIKEVNTPNGISYHRGGNDVVHDFWYLGKGEWRWQDIKKLYFWLIYAQY